MADGDWCYLTEESYKPFIFPSYICYPLHFVVNSQNKCSAPRCFDQLIPCLRAITPYSKEANFMRARTKHNPHLLTTCLQQELNFFLTPYQPKLMPCWDLHMCNNAITLTDEIIS